MTDLRAVGSGKRHGGPAETRGLPDCFRANHRRLSGSPGPLRTLRAGPRGTGELSRKWGSSEASPPLSVPLRGGLSGNGMLPVFLQHLSPPVGACGERNAALFSAAFDPEYQGRDSDLASKTHNQPILSSKTGRCRNSPNLANDGTATWHRLKSSLLFDQTPLLRLPPIRGSLNKPQRTLKSSEFVAREQPKTGLVQTPSDPTKPEQTSKDAQKLRIRGPGAPHVQVLECEVWTLHSTETHSPS